MPRLLYWFPWILDSRELFIQARLHQEDSANIVLWCTSYNCLGSYLPWARTLSEAFLSLHTNHYLRIVASGLTRLWCLARVLRALTHKTGFRFQQENRKAQKLGSLSYGMNSCLYRTLGAPEHDVRHSKQGTSWWKLMRGERDWSTQSGHLRNWLSPTLRSREQQVLRLLKIE